jgi:FkbM family methyltransferase
MSSRVQRVARLGAVAVVAAVVVLLVTSPGGPGSPSSSGDPGDSPPPVPDPSAARYDSDVGATRTRGATGAPGRREARVLPQAYTCPEHPTAHHMQLDGGRVDYWLCMHHPREDIYISLLLLDGKIFEQSKVNVYLKLLQDRKPAVTVLDLGANLGYFAVLAAALGHRTIAVEPMPHNFALLRASTELNGLQDRLRLVNKAGAPTEDAAPLHICSDPQNQGDSAVVPGGHVHADGRRCHTVETTTLNRVLADEGAAPMLLKTDTQGYDAVILDATRGGAALWRVPPAVILLEWEPKRMRRVSDADPLAFLRGIHNRGYVV